MHSSTVGSTRMMSPMGPPMSSRGMKAARVVSEEVTTGTHMRRAPETAASMGVLPPAKWVAASSPTTMASSTTIPRAMMKPISAMMLIP